MMLSYKLRALTFAFVHQLLSCQDVKVSVIGHRPLRLLFLI